MEVRFLDLRPQYEVLREKINQRMEAVFKHTQFIMGPEVTQLEEDLSRFIDVPHSIVCSSGTDALLLSLMALGVGQGDEVITTPFTFAATAEAIVLAGATPVFVDIDPLTYNISTEEVVKAINSKTKAIMPVALFGQPADMNGLMQLGEKHKLWVIEDAAQSFGARYQGHFSGALGHVSCTSFFPSKPLGCYGDGGAVFTHSEEIEKKVRQLINHGQVQRDHHECIGINGRLDSLQAAILLCKLERYEWELKQRQKIASNYTRCLKPMEIKASWQLPVEASGCQSIWSQYTICVPNRCEIQEHLKRHGVPSQVYYPTVLSEQPAYVDCSISHSLKQAKRACHRVMSLPIYADMGEEVQQRIIEVLLESLH